MTIFTHFYHLAYVWRKLLMSNISVFPPNRIHLTQSYQKGRSGPTDLAQGACKSPDRQIFEKVKNYSELPGLQARFLHQVPWYFDHA